MLKVHTRNLGSFTILCLEGRIVNGETATLRNAVTALSGVRSVVLDMSQVSTVDARGLGVMLELRELTQSRGMGFKVMNVPRLVGEVLRVTRLDSVFDIISAIELFPALSNRPRKMVWAAWASCA